MGKKIDNFSFFGQTFQLKLVYSLLHDPKFTEQIIEYLHTKYFDNESYAWTIDVIRQHFLKYKEPPTLDALAIYVKEIPNDILKTTVKDSLRGMFKNTEGMEQIKDKTIEFCQTQAFKNAVYESVDLVNGGKHEEARQLFNEASKVAMDTDVGHVYTEMFEQRISETARNTIKTGWNVIDNIMDGGLGPGELGVIVAPPGIGKSWGLASLASTAMRNGKNVIYYTMELNKEYVGLRFDSILTGIPSQNLKFHQEDVKEKLQDISGYLLIKYYPTKTASINTIRNHVEKTQRIKGIKPDIICLDYADLLTGHGKEKRFILENIYEELRGLAGELEIPIWTASQANRSSLEHDIIEADKIAESFAKIMVSDIVMSLSRKVTDKVSGTARWHIIKNRLGKDGITFPSKFNASNGHIEIFEEQSFSGKDATHKMDNGNEVIRQLHAQKYKELKDDEDGKKSDFE